MSKMRNYTRLRYFFTVFVLCFVTLGRYSAHAMLNLAEGESCPREEISFKSSCRKSEDCPAAEEIIKSNKVIVCSFKDEIPVICCPETNNITLTANPTTIATSKHSVNPENPVKTKRTPAIRMCGKYSKLVDTTTTGCDAFTNDTGVASPKQFPHMVLIGYNLKPDDSAWGCMGSLISKRYVLTAARCVKKTYAFAMKYAQWARVGALDYVANSNGADGPGFDYKIDKRIKHPLYKPPSMYHDIGLLRLEKGVVFSPFLRPICLNTKASSRPEEVIATGWGHVDGTGPTSERLLQVRGNTITAEQCDKNLRYMRRRNKQLPEGIVGDQMVCSENANNGKHTSCAGFLGGPIHVKHKQFECMYTQIGITSFASGRFCEDNNSTTVYTLVSNYVSWIEPIVFPKKFDFSIFDNVPS